MFWAPMCFPTSTDGPVVPPKAMGMIGANFISSSGESAAISRPMMATISDTIDCRPKLLPNALI
ncbi:hypothetical protein E3T47_11530 [Cryobacterium ruanii]|uniref:Uncharacterized protein n=1 Tax=Cryobacterium ruanii TaxID=1259197 RepID=A0A4R9AL81_9MICO|nr:hypothetical protein E3T47_11530 [Cryobacterium ruanii]